jgi:hypothetical protein
MPLPPPVMSTFLSANDIAMVWDRIDWRIGGKPAEFGGSNSGGMGQVPGVALTISKDGRPGVVKVGGGGGEVIGGVDGLEFEHGGDGWWCGCGDVPD